MANPNPTKQVEPLSRLAPGLSHQFTMKLNIVKPVQVDAKEIRIYCKVCDNFTAHVYDANGEVLGGQDDGYVASFMPGEHCGDYLILNIDMESGVVTNWKKPTPEQVEKFLKQEGDE